MSKIPGTYEHVSNENFVEYLIVAGIPEEKAKKADALKPKVTVKVDGNKISFESDSGVVKTSTTFVVDQEIDEKSLEGHVLKSTTSLNGDSFTVTSKTENGKVGYRAHFFSDTDLIITLTSNEPNAPVAKRTYKRV